MNVVKYFKGLSEPIRLRIAVLLLEQELCVCDLMEVLQVPQSTISRHMALLKAAGLVLDRRNSKWVHYRYAGNRAVEELRDYLRRNCLEDEPHRADLAKLKGYLGTKNCS